jgi:hypothetical protein
VEERATYRDLADEILRHVAIRESAVAGVVRSVGDQPQLDSMSKSLERRSSIHRRMISKIRRKSRRLRDVDLHPGQDLLGPLNDLVQAVGPEIE